MDIFFADPSEIPLPPDEVRILDLKIKPYPDGRRLKMFLELTPFQKKPNGDIQISNVYGEEVASTSFIEAITPKLEMTLHLRTRDPDGQYKAKVTVFYTEEIEDGTKDDRTLLRPEKVIVDETTLSFKINH